MIEYLKYKHTKMGVICNDDNRCGKCIDDKESNIHTIKANIKGEITRIDEDIEILTSEVNELYKKLNSTNGNMNQDEREDIENDLYKKIEELEELRLNKRALNTDLTKITQGERNKRIENIMKRNDKCLNKNKPNNQYLEERYENINDIKRENEIRKETIKNGVNMLNGNKSRYEKIAKINKFFNNNK